MKSEDAKTTTGCRLSAPFIILTLVNGLYFGSTIKTKGDMPYV